MAARPSLDRRRLRPHSVRLGRRPLQVIRPHSAAALYKPTTRVGAPCAPRHTPTRTHAHTRTHARARARTHAHTRRLNDEAVPLLSATRLSLSSLRGYKRPLSRPPPTRHKPVPPPSTLSNEPRPSTSPLYKLQRRRLHSTSPAFSAPQSRPPASKLEKPEKFSPGPSQGKPYWEVQGVGCRVQSAGCRVQGLMCSHLGPKRRHFLLVWAQGSRLVKEARNRDIY